MRWTKVLNVVECHADAEVAKVMTGGVATCPNDTILYKKLYLEQHFDEVRKLLRSRPTT